MTIDKLINAAYVTRFHTLRDQSDSLPDNVNAQTIGEHSFGVALIIAKLHPKPTVNLLKAAIYHDLPEKELGDIPAHAKWRFGDYAQAFNEAEDIIEREYDIEVFLDHDERVWLACADMLELLFYVTWRADLKDASLEWAVIEARCIDWFQHRIELIPDAIKQELIECEFLPAE